MTRVLVCGGRDFSHYELLSGTMLFFHKAIPFSVVIHGGAKGADSLSGLWARANKVRELVFKADWEKHGNGAGYARNKIMLEQGKPDLVLAFKGGKGTAHMVKIAMEAGIEVIQVEENYE